MNSNEISMLRNKTDMVYTAITLCDEDTIVEQIKKGKIYSQQKLTLSYNYNGELINIMLTVEEYINNYVEIYGYDKYFKFLSKLVYR